MFRVVSIVGIVGMAVLMYHVRRRSNGKRVSQGYVICVRTVVAFLTLVCASLLALSGFTATVVGRSMTGYLLLAHVAVGGVFIVCLAAAALWWSEAHGVSSLKDAEGSGSAGGRPGVVRKTFFWCFVAFGCGSAVTILLSMVPVFGSEGVAVLSELHRWCALFLVMVGIGFTMSR
jgi:hypothetical protein